MKRSLPEGLDDPITDTFGQPVLRVGESCLRCGWLPTEPVTVRECLIRSLEATRATGATEAMYLAQKLLQAEAGEEWDEPWLKTLAEAVKQNPRGYAPVVLAPLLRYVELISASRAGVP